MADYYEILERIGSKPVQLVVGENADGDTRYRIDVTYNFRGAEHRKSWMPLTQLKMIYELLNAFFDDGKPCDGADETADTVTGNGTEPPF